jgi:outer membrane protein TolC
VSAWTAAGAIAIVLALTVGTVPAVAQPSSPDGVPLAFAGLSLEGAQQAAVSSSPDLSAANAVVNQNAAALAAARSALGPALVSGYGVTPQAGANGNTITSRMLTVGVQTTIGDIAAYSPLVAAAIANLRTAQSGRQAAALAERLKVIGLYYNALKARAVRGARESALAAANEQSTAAQIRFKAGDAPNLDVVRARVAVAKATSDAEFARVADTNATEALRIETGALESAFTTTTPAPPQSLAVLDPASAVARARLLRPELAASQQTTAAAQAAQRAARRATLPAVTLGVGYATGVDGGQHVSSPTLNVSLNLPLNGAARARTDQAAALVAEAQAKADALSRSIEVTVAADARSVVAAQRASAASSEARRQADAQLAATQLGYRNGASSSLELTLARDVDTQAVVDELSVLYDEARARAALALEVGG